MKSCNFWLSAKPVSPTRSKRSPRCCSTNSQLLHGRREEFFRFFEQVSNFLGPTERDLAVVAWIPLPGAAKAPPRTVTMVERPEGILRLATEVGELIAKWGPKSFGDGINALTGTMLTAIEATCDRERADEFDLLIGGFLKWVQSGERVQ